MTFPSAPEPKEVPRTTLPPFRVSNLMVMVLIAAVSFLGGMYFASATDSPHDDEDFRVFWQSWDILEHDFYFDLPSDTTLTYGAIQGLLATTKDPYTFFQPPTAAELDRQAIAGEFGGIGAYVGMTQAGDLIITAPFEGAPAERAGLLAGDVIETVDGVTITGWTFDDALNVLRGDVGDAVTLGIFRSETDTHFEVEITRERVELPTVEARMVDDVGYVRLYRFNGLARLELEAAVADLLKSEPRALILDLRDNPGGLLDQAVAVSDLFLDEGIVVTQRSRNGNEIIYPSATGDIGEDIDLIILQDTGSASASEVVAGALRDRERAILVGQTSYGKGSVQHVHDLDDDSQLHVTTALWFTPNETPIQGQGLAPDVEVPLDAEFEGSTDPYIAAALDYLDEAIAAESSD